MHVFDIKPIIALTQIAVVHITPDYQTPLEYLENTLRDQQKLLPMYSASAIACDDVSAVIAYKRKFERLRLSDGGRGYNGILTAAFRRQAEGR